HHRADHRNTTHRTTGIHDDHKSTRPDRSPGDPGEPPEHGGSWRLSEWRLPDRSFHAVRQTPPENCHQPLAIFSMTWKGPVGSGYYPSEQIIPFIVYCGLKRPFYDICKSQRAF